MRAVLEIKYEIIKQADVSSNYIYAFGNDQEISFLCQKDDKYFWKPLTSTNRVWYKMYSSIEKAIEGVVKLEEFVNQSSQINEFYSMKEFLSWAYQLTHPELPAVLQPEPKDALS